MFSIFHHQTAEYIFFFFSSAYETLSGMDHILGHKSSLAKFKKLKSEQAIFSDHTDTWLGIIYRKICKKTTNTWRNKTGHWRNQRGNLEYLKTNGNEWMTTQNLCDAIKPMLRGKFIAIQEAYLKKWKEHQINNLI